MTENATRLARPLLLATLAAALVILPESSARAGEGAALAEGPPSVPAAVPVTPAAVAAPSDAAGATSGALPGGEFTFGSYGRIVAGSDLRGGSGYPTNVVSHGPRLHEAPYLELDLAYRLTAESGARFTTVTTLAVTDALLHYDGDFGGALALRNAYVEAAEFGAPGLRIWAGSRMWRGDDIHLLDLWPLDELNTVGGGLSLDLPADLRVRLHAGVNRVADRTTYQERTVPARGRAGTEQLLLLDRQRLLASARVEQHFHGLGDFGARWLLYGETHRVGEGEFIDDEDTRRDLPDDVGFLLGAQLGGWHAPSGSFVNVFLRWATGLAAYGELGLPTSTDANLRARGARQLRAGLSANAELGPAGIMAAAFVQQFRVPHRTRFNPDDYTEAVLALRPVWYVTDHLHAGAEVSWQTRAPRGLSPANDAWERPEVLQFALLPALSLERGTYSRPQLRGIWSVSLRNDAARNLFPDGDRRGEERVVHFLGVGAEWWFNSSSYP